MRRLTKTKMKSPDVPHWSLSTCTCYRAVKYHLIWRAKQVWRPAKGELRLQCWHCSFSSFTCCLLALSWWLLGQYCFFTTVIFFPRLVSLFGLCDVGLKIKTSPCSSSSLPPVWWINLFVEALVIQRHSAWYEDKINTIWIYYAINVVIFVPWLYTLPVKSWTVSYTYCGYYSSIFFVF